MNEDQDILAELHVSYARLVIAVGMFGFLGILLVYLGFSLPPVALLGNLALVGFGVVALYFGFRLYSSRGYILRLTRAGLFDGEGRLICPVENVAKIERGAFAFKPSNGFSLVLKEKIPVGWQPGVYWGGGRRVGVGGVVSAGQAKFMADMFSLHLAGSI